ncbi:MAG TPA: hypothetical protein VH833_07425 [Gemmatimonadales bacterium]|jgi:hypothetical protein
MAPDTLPEPLRVALAIAATLERLRVPYVVVGSLASSLYGAPRSTDDVDFLVALPPDAVPLLVTALIPEYYVSAEAARDAATARHGGAFNAIHLGSAVKVDLFVAGDDRFDAERLARRQLVRLTGELAAAPADVFVDTAEHTVLRKLEWYRRGGAVSERQWGDVIGVVREQGERLDRDYMRAWGERLGVGDLLDRAFREGGSD